MDYHALTKMTVNNLREEAKKHDIAGVTGMNKQELIDAVAAKLNLEKPAAKPKKSKKVALDKTAIRQKITKLRELRATARANSDRKQVKLLRRRLHLLKRQLTRAA